MWVWKKQCAYVESSWNVMAQDDARVGKCSGKFRMECVASTLHTTSKHVVSSIITADAHFSAASSRLNRRPCPFNFINLTVCGRVWNVMAHAKKTRFRFSPKRAIPFQNVGVGSFQSTTGSQGMRINGQRF